MLTVCAQRGGRKRREVIGGLVQTPPLGIKTSSRGMAAFHDNGAAPFPSRFLFFLFSLLQGSCSTHFLNYSENLEKKTE